MAQFQVYKSSDPGAPALSGQVGALVALLDACLVTGYTSSVTSITRSGGTATVTIATPHNLFVGMSVTIAGANESDYNGVFTVTAITALNVFQYAVGGSPASPATGTITWMKTPAGWTKPFTGANKAAFLQGAGSNGFYLRVQDDAPVSARDARLLGYEVMIDVDTGTGPFPTVAQMANGLFARKSTSVDATARNWILVADSRTVYFFCLPGAGDTNGTTRYRPFMFGDIYSLLSGDAYGTMLIARDQENGAADGSGRLDVITNTLISILAHYIARGHNGTGGSVAVGKHGDRQKANSFGFLAGSVPYTNPSNGAFYLSRLWVHDPTTTPVKCLRGRIRGLWHWVHAATPLIDGDVLVGTGELAGKTFLAIRSGEAGGGGTDTILTIEVSNTVETN